MMSRLIDADRALEIVYKRGIAHPNAYYLTNYAMLVLQEEPTADAVEVKHGRWVQQPLNGTHIWRCSKCETIGSPQWNYCPKCGARMIEEGNT